MIMHNSPYPKMNAEERLRAPIDEVIVISSDSETSDDESNVVNNNINDDFNYQLLPQDIPNGEENVDENTGNAMDSNSEATANLARLVESEIEDCTRKSEECDNKERREIEINLEEVQAAMRNITLPPSAIPAWASNIPESEWNRIMTSILPKINK